MKTSAPLSRRDLESTLLEIAERQQLHWVNAADYQNLGVIEGIGHELAHALDLGPDFEFELNTMGAVEANEHESTALRIELAALTRLGVRLSLRRLWSCANWREIGAPSRRQLSLPLTQHEHACVNRFVATIQKATTQSTSHQTKTSKRE